MSDIILFFSVFFELCYAHIFNRPQLENKTVIKEASTKAEAGEAVEAEQTKKKKKKKKKLSNEALKKKKERKMFEVEGQFKGQEMPSFTGIVMTDNMNFSAVNGSVRNLSSLQCKGQRPKLATS